VCFSDGTEAIVGVKAEIERSRANNEQEDQEDGAAQRQVRGDWVEIAVEIPGLRDDDASTVFLGEMIREALLGDGDFARKLWINRRFHWRLYLDARLPLPNDTLARDKKLTCDRSCSYRRLCHILFRSSR
jgi:exosome complex component RRP42